MNYLEAKKKLFDKINQLTKLSLENINYTRQCLLPDFLSYPVIHVAGTNGKGSVCTKMMKTLSYKGYKVGLYTSPHVFSFRERIQINSKKILQKEFLEEITKLFILEKQICTKLSFFETLTLLAFYYFEKNKVDIAIIETGMGGRLDATNIIIPQLCVITSIGYDHMPTLGKNLEQVGQEKAGIIKHKVPLVLGPTVVQKSIWKQAEDKKAPIHYVSADAAECFDTHNQKIARTALHVIADKYYLDKQVIEKGIQAKPPCRFSIRNYLSTTVIFDGAHNISAFEKLFDKIFQHYGKHSIDMIFSLSKNKDMRTCLSFLIKRVRHFYLLSYDHDKIQPTQKISRQLKELQYPYFSIVTLTEKQVLQILDIAKKNHALLLVGGSFFSMGYAYQRLKRFGLRQTSTQII